VIRRRTGRRAAGLVSAALLVAADQAPARLELELNPTHSSLEFSVPFMGLTSVRGTFEDFAGLLLYDAARPERTSVTFVVQTGSLHTGNSVRDKHLRSDDFFDAERFPTLLYQSDSVVRRGPGAYAAYGRLRIRDVTRPMVLPVRMRHRLTLDRDGVDYLGFDIATRLDWRSFGIPATNRNNPWFQPAKMLVNDSVDLRISIEAIHRRTSRIHYPGLDTLMKLVGTGGTEAVARRYDEVRSKGNDSVARFLGPFPDAGRALAELGRPGEAVALLRLLQEADPESADASAALAGAQLAAGDSSGAVASYRQALATDAVNPAALEMLRHLAPAHAGSR